VASCRNLLTLECQNGSSKRQQLHRPQVPSTDRHRPADLPGWSVLTFLPLVRIEVVGQSRPIQMCRPKPMRQRPEFIGGHHCGSGLLSLRCPQKTFLT
jgi:hypothetical protein